VPTRPRRRSGAPSRRQRDGALGAVSLSVGGLRLEFTGDLVGMYRRVADLVGVKDFRRQGVATPVADAAICVNIDACHGAGTGNVNGSDSTDRNAAV